MNEYIVTRNSDGTEVYRYQADAPIEWAGMDFVNFTHSLVAPQVAVVDTVSRRMSKLAFVGRLGADFTTILVASKTNVQVELFVKMLDWATPDADGTSVDLADLRVIDALNSLESAGLIAQGRAAEILNGN